MQNAAATNEDDEQPKESGWMSRLTNAFRGKSSGEGSGSDDSNSDSGTRSAASGTSKSRQRPNLTIRTSLSNAAFANVSRDRLPTAGNNTPVSRPSQSPQRVRNDPPSAWSISPAPPRTLPWLPNPASTAGKRPKGQGKPRFPGLPISPRPAQGLAPTNRSINAGYNYGGASTGTAGVGAFPTPAAPTAAATVTPAAQVPFSAQSQAQSVVPSYYQSHLPHYAARDSLLPENTLAAVHGGRRHNRTSSVPLPKLASRATPGGGGGGGATTIDPFRTPFDDDARVVPENWPQPPISAGPTNLNTNRNRDSNPFSPKAL